MLTGKYCISPNKRQLQNPFFSTGVFKFLKKSENLENYLKPSPHPTRHSGKTLKLHGKTRKINPENKQSQTSGSTQATTFSQDTSIASKSSTITTAQYASLRTQ
jgi:hypothetical protein